MWLLRKRNIDAFLLHFLASVSLVYAYISLVILDVNRGRSYKFFDDITEFNTRSGKCDR